MIRSAPSSRKICNWDHCKWLQTTCWHCSISVNKTSLSLKYGHFFLNWSILSELEYCVRCWFLTRGEVLCPFSPLPDSCNIAAYYSSDTAWKISFRTKQPLPACTTAWRGPALRSKYCAERDSKSFDLCPLLHSGMAEGAGVSDFFH